MGQLETTVPGNGAPPNECDYCDRPFPTSDRLDLHRGIEHFGRLDESERETFEAARAEERDDLSRFRLKALGVLVLLYFGFLFLYAIFA